MRCSVGAGKGWRNKSGGRCLPMTREPPVVLREDFGISRESGFRKLRRPCVLAKGLGGGASIFPSSKYTSRSAGSAASRWWRRRHITQLRHRTALPDILWCRHVVTCFNSAVREGTMKLARRRILRVAASLVVLPTVWRVALAQPYPARLVRVIIPFAPGGPTDLFARPLAQNLSESLGKQFYIENVGGAGGSLGMGQAAKAPPDGYTILIVSPSLAVNPSLYDKVPYDPLNDFAAVTLAVSTPIVLTTHPTLPVKTVQELVDLVRANPGKYSYA